MVATKTINRIDVKIGKRHVVYVTTFFHYCRAGLGITVFAKTDPGSAGHLSRGNKFLSESSAKNLRDITHLLSHYLFIAPLVRTTNLGDT